MDMGGEVFTMALALKLQRVAAPSTALENGIIGGPSSTLRLTSDGSSASDNYSNVRLDNIKVIIFVFFFFK